MTEDPTVLETKETSRAAYEAFLAAQAALRDARAALHTFRERGGPSYERNFLEAELEARQAAFDEAEGARDLALDQLRAAKEAAKAERAPEVRGLYALAVRRLDEALAAAVAANVELIALEEAEGLARGRAGGFLSLRWQRGWLTAEGLALWRRNAAQAGIDGLAVERSRPKAEFPVTVVRITQKRSGLPYTPGDIVGLDPEDARGAIAQGFAEFVEDKLVSRQPLRQYIDIDTPKQATVRDDDGVLGRVGAWVRTVVPR